MPNTASDNSMSPTCAPLTLNTATLGIASSSFLKRLSFHRRFNLYEAVLRARDRTLDENNVALGVHTDDFEVLNRDRLVAHMTRQALALRNTVRDRKSTRLNSSHVKIS